MSLLGQPPPILFKLVTPGVDCGPSLIELTGQALLRCDQLRSRFGIALDEPLSSFGQSLALLNNGLALAGDMLILLTLFLHASRGEIGKPLITHVGLWATSGSGQQRENRQGHAGQRGPFHASSSNG